MTNLWMIWSRHLRFSPGYFEEFVFIVSRRHGFDGGRALDSDDAV